MSVHTTQSPGRGTALPAAPLRVALITEGTYPIVTGGVSTWCDQLLSGLPEYSFDVVALTADGGERLVWKPPANVADVRLIGVWGPSAPALPPLPGRRRRVESVQRALTHLWAAALGPDTADSGERTEAALRELTELSSTVSLARALATRGSVEPILSAWARHISAPGDPVISVADAVLASSIVDRSLALLDQRLHEVDVIHASGNGPSALLALAESWRNGTPVLLTEHGVYLRERYLALDGGSFSWPVRRAVTAFLRRLSQVVHAHASMILPVNQFNARWERRLGADPARIHTIPNGVDPSRFPPVTDEPELPTISFVGRIDPLKDLGTLISAFALVRERVPDAQLRLFGPTPPENAAYRARLEEQVQELGVAAGVHWEGPSKGSRPAIAAGHVVALSSVSEGLPFTLIESMMCGRATVSTDVGGVSECLDPQRTTGTLVPARDPEAFADACVELLTDATARAAMGAAARRRALAEFTLEKCLNRYADAYAAARDGRLLDATPSAAPADPAPTSQPAPLPAPQLIPPPALRPARTADAALELSA